MSEVKELYLFMFENNLIESHPGPLLRKFLKKGQIWRRGYEYLGKTNLGKVVSIGLKGAEKRVEEFLLKHPSPETWAYE